MLLNKRRDVNWARRTSFDTWNNFPGMSKGRVVVVRAEKHGQTITVGGVYLPPRETQRRELAEELTRNTEDQRRTGEDQDEGEIDEEEQLGYPKCDVLMGDFDPIVAPRPFLDTT